jgi:hypothetical protein
MPKEGQPSSVKVHSRNATPFGIERPGIAVPGLAGMTDWCRFPRQAGSRGFPDGTETLKSRLKWQMLNETASNK